MPIASPRSLSRAQQKVLVYRFFDPGLGGSGGPREAPLGYPWAFPEPPGASRRPTGPKTNQSKKPRNLKGLTERWRGHSVSILHTAIATQISKPATSRTMRICTFDSNRNHYAGNSTQQATIANPHTGLAPKRLFRGSLGASYEAPSMLSQTHLAQDTYADLHF